MIDYYGMKESKLRNSRWNRFLMGNRYVFRSYSKILYAEKNKVNLNAWISMKEAKNVGDYLSVVVVENMCKHYDLCREQPISKTRHLYAVGSVLLGFQNATIWGSGFLKDIEKDKYYALEKMLHRIGHGIDVRAVRGPETRRILRNMGYACPEVYGDPAVLMPLFYKGSTKKVRDYLVVPHYSLQHKYKGMDAAISTFTKDYKYFIETITSSELVISSSLHGIILAEAYGIPAIMLKDTPTDDILKYRDWYYSTGRYEFPVAESVEEALTLPREVLSRDTVAEMQQNLIRTFPADLWD